MVMQWYEYSVREIYDLYVRLGYEAEIIIEPKKVYCVVQIEDDKIAYVARSPNHKIKEVQVLDDERGRWR